MNNKYLEKIASIRFVREMVGDGASAVAKGVARFSGKRSGKVGSPNVISAADKAEISSNIRNRAAFNLKQHGPVYKHDTAGPGSSLANYKENMYPGSRGRIPFPDAKK